MGESFFTPAQGVSLLAGYGTLAFALTWFFSRGRTLTKLTFLAADRKVGTWEAAFSIAATWIWAPALFLASQKAFTQGLAGVFWFTVPNVLCLIIFAFFAERVRTLAPEGFTLSAFMRDRHSKRVQVLYLIQMAGLAACSFAVQLLAGGKVITALTGIPFSYITLTLAVIALSYSLFSGLKASVITDYGQMLIILAVTLVAVPWAVSAAGGWKTVYVGLGGTTGTFGNLFAGDGLKTAWSFGIPVTIGLLAGPFGDQSFWQRAFAIESGKVKKAFIRSAFIFALVPISLSLLGFIAAAKGMNPADKQLVNLEVIKEFLPGWVILPFAFMLLSGLISTLDSNLCAISSLFGHDLVNDKNHEEKEKDGTKSKVVILSRISMIALAIIALIISNISGIKILYLFLFYGTMRASTLLPTIFTIISKRVKEKAVFTGILLSITIGLPVFAYGNFNKITNLAVLGVILTVGISGLVVGITLQKKD
ncbi:MAG: sodium:solute symporter family transporter [Planctomycetota bacterium]|jgi:Na+/proline symporter